MIPLQPQGDCTDGVGLGMAESISDQVPKAVGKNGRQISNRFKAMVCGLCWMSICRRVCLFCVVLFLCVINVIVLCVYSIFFLLIKEIITGAST